MGLFILYVLFKIANRFLYLSCRNYVDIYGILLCLRMFEYIFIFYQCEVISRKYQIRVSVCIRYCLELNWHFPPVLVSSEVSLFHGFDSSFLDKVDKETIFTCNES